MQMDKKQKTLLVVTIAAFGYLGYQVYGLVSQDVSSQPAVVQTGSSYQSQMASNNSVNPVQTAQAAPRNVRMQEAISQAENGAPKHAQLQSQPLVKGQKAYLNMVNQYELAKMKRRLLEERAAIAAAQHRIATLNKQTRGIDQSMLEQPAAEYNNASNVASKTPYQLSYLDNQHGQWTATLNLAGHYHEVSIGAELPNGAKILKIDREGVTLESGDQNELVTFNGTIPIKTQAAKVKEESKPATPKATVKVPKKAAVETLETNKTILSEDTIEKAAQKALLNAGLLPKKKEGAEKAKVIKTSDEIKAAPAAAKLDDRIEAGLANPAEKMEHDIALKQADVLHAEAVVPAKKEDHDIVVAQKYAPKVVKKPAKKLAAKIEVKSAKGPVIMLADASAKNLGPANAKALLAKASPAIGLDKPVKAEVSMPTAGSPLNTKARYTEDERRLLQLSSHDYTIQLIGSYHRDIVENFAIANDLGNEAMQFHVANRGRPWYMLLYGDYRTQAQAQKALHRLSPNLTPERPWIRQVAEVQHDVRNRAHG